MKVMMTQLRTFDETTVAMPISASLSRKKRVMRDA
jgi:hypothetical protein